MQTRSGKDLPDPPPKSKRQIRQPTVPKAPSKPKPSRKAIPSQSKVKEVRVPSPSPAQSKKRHATAPPPGAKAAKAAKTTKASEAPPRKGGKKGRGKKEVHFEKDKPYKPSIVNTVLSDVDLSDASLSDDDVEALIAQPVASTKGKGKKTHSVNDKPYKPSVVNTVASDDELSNLDFSEDDLAASNGKPTANNKGKGKGKKKDQPVRDSLYKPAAATALSSDGDLSDPPLSEDDSPPTVSKKAKGKGKGKEKQQSQLRKGPKQLLLDELTEELFSDINKQVGRLGGPWPAPRGVGEEGRSNGAGQPRSQNRTADSSENGVEYDGDNEVDPPPTRRNTIHDPSSAITANLPSTSTAQNSRSTDADTAYTARYTDLKSLAFQWCSTHFPPPPPPPTSPSLSLPTLAHTSPQLMEYANYISACTRHPWSHIFTTQRPFLVFGILGKMLEIHVFGAEMFGGTPAQIAELRALDEESVMGDGFERQRVRAVMIEAFLEGGKGKGVEGRVLPVDFVPALAELQGRFMKMVAPLLTTSSSPSEEQAMQNSLSRILFAAATLSLSTRSEAHTIYNFHTHPAIGSLYSGSTSEIIDRDSETEQIESEDEDEDRGIDDVKAMEMRVVTMAGWPSLVSYRVNEGRGAGREKGKGLFDDENWGDEEEEDDDGDGGVGEIYQGPYMDINVVGKAPVLVERGDNVTPAMNREGGTWLGPSLRQEVGGWAVGKDVGGREGREEDRGREAGEEEEEIEGQEEEEEEERDRNERAAVVGSGLALGSQMALGFAWQVGLFGKVREWTGL